MKKLYRIILILIAFIFLTTYSPTNLNVLPEKENFFFKIQNIKIINNNIVNENEIKRKLGHIYGANILTIKRNDVATPLKSIDFLGKIEVKKKYPNIIFKFKNYKKKYSDKEKFTRMIASHSFEHFENFEINFLKLLNQVIKCCHNHLSH